MEQRHGGWVIDYKAEWMVAVNKFGSISNYKKILASNIKMERGGTSI